jgi:hypothetical protein
VRSGSGFRDFGLISTLEADVQIITYGQNFWIGARRCKAKSRYGEEQVGFMLWSRPSIRNERRVEHAVK